MTEIQYHDVDAYLKADRSADGSSGGTSTATAASLTVIYAVGESSAAGDTSAQGLSFAVAAGVSITQSTAEAIGAATSATIASSSGLATVNAAARVDAFGTGTADGEGIISGTGRALNAAIGQADGSSAATAGHGFGAKASAGGEGGAQASLTVKTRRFGICTGTSLAAGDGVALFKINGSSIAVSVVNATSKSTNKVIATSAATSITTSVGTSLAAASGLCAGTGAAAGVGSIGRRIIGSSICTSIAAAQGRSNFSATGLCQAISGGTADTKAMAKSTGLSESSAVVNIRPSLGLNSVANSTGTSRVEARKPSDEAIFMSMISQRRGLLNTGYTSARMLELSGAEIIEPTAFEPDATTHRSKYYYNAVTNILYMKVVSRKQPGIIVAHWQKVSQ